MRGATTSKSLDLLDSNKAVWPSFVELVEVLLNYVLIGLNRLGFIVYSWVLLHLAELAHHRHTKEKGRFRKPP